MDAKSTNPEQVEKITHTLSALSRYVH